MNTSRVKKMLPLLAMLMIGVSVTLGIVYITRPITMTGTIISQKDMKVYSDAACTVEFTAWAIGDQIRGATIDKVLWVKNLGDVTMKMQWSTGTPAPPTGVTITANWYTGTNPESWVSGATGSTNWDLAPGASNKIQLHLNIGSTAPIDTAIDYQILVTGNS